MGAEILTIPTSRLNQSLARDKIVPLNPKKDVVVNIESRKKEIKKRVEEAMIRDCEKWMEDFADMTLEHFPMGSMNLDSVKSSQIQTAMQLFASYLYDIHINQDDDLRLYNTSIHALGLDERLQKAIMCFILNPADTLNNSIMHSYILELDEFHNNQPVTFTPEREEEIEDQGGFHINEKSGQFEFTFEYGGTDKGSDSRHGQQEDAEPSYYYLSIYLEFILQATMENLENGLLHINTSFMNKVRS